MDKENENIFSLDDQFEDEIELSALNNSTNGIDYFETENDHDGLLMGGGRRRVSSFEFDLHAIPLSLSLNKMQDEGSLGKSLGLLNGLSMIIGMMIGSGIFASPGPILLYTKSVGMALFVWLAGGLLAISGSLCYCELGTMIQTSGGEHPYLLHAYGELPAFLFSWTGIVCVRPGGLAIITITFSEYVSRLIYFNSHGHEVPILLIKSIAIIAILVLSALNALSTKVGTAVQNFFTATKLLSLFAIGIMGLVTLAEGASKADNFHTIFVGSSTNLGDYALALYSALWAYDGWNNLNLVTGELKNPSVNLPRAVTIGPGIVILSYILANIAYYAVLPLDVIGHSHSIAMDFGKAVFGNLGAILIPAAVIGSTFGAANASVFTSARVVYISSKHGHAPSLLGRVHPKTHTPIYAIAQQAILSLVFVVVGSFKSLVNFFGMITWSFYLLAVVGLVVLRFREPHLERPYKVWWITPFIFCSSSLFLVALSILEKPVQALGAVLFILSGVPVWYYTVHKREAFERFQSKFFGSSGVQSDVQYVDLQDEDEDVLDNEGDREF